MLKPQGKAPEGESSCGPSVCVPTIDTRNRMGGNRPPSFDDKKTGKNAKDSRQATLDGKMGHRKTDKTIVSVLEAQVNWGIRTMGIAYMYVQ